MALVVIYQAISKDIHLMLAKKNLAKAAWETLQTMHVGVKCVKEAKVQILNSEFVAIRMKDSESIHNLGMKLTMIFSNIRSLGYKVEEIFVVKNFFKLSPPRFMHIVTSIKQCSALKNMFVEEVVSCLKIHEKRLCGHKEGGGKKKKPHLAHT